MSAADTTPAPPPCEEMALACAEDLDDAIAALRVQVHNLENVASCLRRPVAAPAPPEAAIELLGARIARLLTVIAERERRILQLEQQLDMSTRAMERMRGAIPLAEVRGAATRAQQYDGGGEEAARGQGALPPLGSQQGVR